MKNIKLNKLKVSLCYGTPPEVHKRTIPEKADLAKFMVKVLEKSDNNTPILLCTQPGTGKTHAVIHGIIPWAKDHQMKVLYISSRTAINAQTKSELVDVVGLSNLKEELTDQGMTVRENFDFVTVYTYQKLYQVYKSDYNALKGYDIFIFDEVHSLIEDASFVRDTHKILKLIDERFAGSIRIYMTATPDDILPHIKSIEHGRNITIYQRKKNYSFVDPHFFSEIKDIQKLINNDNTKEKWIVYMQGILSGERFAKDIKHQCCFLNREVREKSPEKYFKILKEQSFPEKVLIATSVVDAGVNFHDKDLRNVVIFSTSPTTFIQFLGRKRIKAGSGEKVRLYAHCPSLRSIGESLKNELQKKEAIMEFSEHKASFIRQYVLEREEMDLSKFVSVDKSGDIQKSTLTECSLDNNINRLREFIAYSQKHDDPYFFDKFVAKWLDIELPERKYCWLDSNITGEDKNNFESFLSSYCKRVMNEDEFKRFADKFRDNCISTFGRSSGGKDRTDRLWGENKINNKLSELNLSFRLDTDKINKTYILNKEEK